MKELFIYWVGVAFRCGVCCLFGLGFCLFGGVLFGISLVFCSVEMVLQCSALVCVQVVPRACHNHPGAGCQMLAAMTWPSPDAFLCHLAVHAATVLSVSKLSDTIFWKQIDKK